MTVTGRDTTTCTECMTARNSAFPPLGTPRTGATELAKCYTGQEPPCHVTLTTDIKERIM